MQSTGVIIHILPASSGTSQRTGNPWMAQSFVIEVSSGDHGQYKHKEVFEIFGEDRIDQAKLQEGATVQVGFDLEAREHEGKWYLRAKAYDVRHVQPQVQQQVQQPQQQQYRQHPQMQQRPPQNGFYQSVQQGYPQPAPYYQQQPQQQYQQQGGYAPQGGYPPQGGGNDDLPF